MSFVNPVLETTSHVIANAEHVAIDTKSVHLLAERVSGFPPFEWDTTHHFAGDEETTAMYFLVLDAMNFCFWADAGEEKWGIVHDGKRLGGYFALSTALKRAFNDDPRFADARYLAAMPGEDLTRILAGHGRIPLLDERLANIHEAGSVLAFDYGGQFSDMIHAAQGSAQDLVELLVTHMPSFEDKATYKGKDIFFRKRAQILVGDIYGALHGEGLGNFHDIAGLTMFADYKVPQLLESYGVLRYSKELCRTIDSLQEIPSGDPREVEIRAASIWAVEMIKDVVFRKGRRMTSLEIDWNLWTLAEGKNFQRPYHCTRTTTY